MPTLRITRRGLAPDYLRATFEYLFGIMLWPADEDRRDEFARSCAAGRRADLAAAVPGAFSADELRALPMESFLARSPEDWREEVLARRARGRQVGAYFAACWYRAVGGERVHVKQLQDMLTTHELRSSHPDLDVSPKTLEAAIREYRPVGPLWAAVVIGLKERIAPFSPEGVEGLLATAEHVRRLAEATPLQGRSEPLLPPGIDVWRPPAWLNLPPLTITSRGP